MSKTNTGFSFAKSTDDYMQSFNNKVNNIVNPPQESFYTPTQSGLSKELEASLADYVKSGKLEQDKRTDMSKGMGSADWAQVGIGGANSLIGLGLGVWQTKIAEDERKAKEKQRQIENERYKQQKAYHEKGITDAANTASGLKSASANVSSQKPQQNTAQAANNPPKEQANTQVQNLPPANNPPQEDLPMQRQ